MEILFTKRAAKNYYSIKEYITVKFGERTAQAFLNKKEKIIILTLFDVRQNPKRKNL